MCGLTEHIGIQCTRQDFSHRKSPVNISYYYCRNVKRPEQVPSPVSGLSFFFRTMGDCTSYPLSALIVLRSLWIQVEGRWILAMEELGIPPLTSLPLWSSTLPSSRPFPLGLRPRWVLMWRWLGGASGHSRARLGCIAQRALCGPGLHLSTPWRM